MSRDSQSWPGGGHRVIATLVLLLISSSHQQNQQKASAELPETSFSCSGRVPGYYADPQTGCQVYHMCEAGGRKFTYSCPEHTLFQQRMMVCDHWFMVDCKSSPQHYAANLLLGDKSKPFLSAGDSVPRHLASASSVKTSPPPASSDPSGRSRLPSKKNQRIFNQNSKNNEILQRKNTTSADVVEQYTFPSTIFTKSTFSPPLSPQTINTQITNIPFTPTTPSPLTRFTVTTQQPQTIKTTTFPQDPSTFINKLRVSSVTPTPTTPTFTSNTIDKLRFSSSKVNPTASTLRATEKPIITLVATPQRKRNNQINVFTPPNPSTTPSKIGFNSQPFIKITPPNRLENSFVSGTTIRPLGLFPSTLANINTARTETLSQTRQNTAETTRQNTPRLSQTTRHNAPETTTFNPTTTFNDDLIYPATINSLFSNSNNEPALLQIIPDTRRMFFIPGNFESIPPSQFEEQNLEFEPSPDVGHFRSMRFNKDIGNFQNGPGCPSKCFPAFFRPGSCEPCVILR